MCFVSYFVLFIGKSRQYIEDLSFFGEMNFSEKNTTVYVSAIKKNIREYIFIHEGKKYVFNVNILKIAKLNKFGRKYFIRRVKNLPHYTHNHMYIDWSTLI